MLLEEGAQKPSEEAGSDYLFLKLFANKKPLTPLTGVSG
jgi:hypothetical protein